MVARHKRRAIPHDIQREGIRRRPRPTHRHRARRRSALEFALHPPAASDGDALLHASRRPDKLRRRRIVHCGRQRDALRGLRIFRKHKPFPRHVRSDGRTLNRDGHRRFQRKPREPRPQRPFRPRIRRQRSARLRLQRGQQPRPHHVQHTL